MQTKKTRKRILNKRLFKYHNEKLRNCKTDLMQYTSPQCTVYYRLSAQQKKTSNQRTT
jgi:hypothetical protein